MKKILLVCLVLAAPLLGFGQSVISKAVGEVDGSIVAYDLEEALNLPKEFDREMYDLISVLSK